MIEYKTQFGPLKVKHVFFAEHIKFMDFYKLVSYSYMRRKLFNPLFIAVKRQTRITDLTQPFDTIFQNIGYYTRREIKRSLKRDLKFTITSDIDEFIEFYNEFAELKNIELLKKKNLKKIPSYTITKVTKGKQILVMHYYITDYDRKLVRAFYGSSKRLNHKTDSKLASQANKFSHYKGLMYFKEKGFKSYDWGGTAEHTRKRTNHQIDEFKKRFGGYLVNEYQYESIPHYFAIKLKKLITGNHI